MRFEELSDDAIRTIAQALLRCDDRRSLRDAVARGEAVLALAATCRAVHRALRQGVLDEARLYAHARIWPRCNGAGMVATQAADERRSQRLLAFVEDAHTVGAFRSAGSGARPNRKDFNSAERKCEVVSKTQMWDPYVPIHLPAGTDDVVMTLDEVPRDDSDDEGDEDGNALLIARRRSASGAFDKCGEPIPVSEYKNQAQGRGRRTCVVQRCDHLEALGESYDAAELPRCTAARFVSVYEWRGDAFHLVERHRVLEHDEGVAVRPESMMLRVFLNARDEPCVVMKYHGTIATLCEHCRTEPSVNWMPAVEFINCSRQDTAVPQDWFAVHNFATGRSTDIFPGEVFEVSASDNAATLAVVTPDGVRVFTGPDYDDVVPQEVRYERAPLSNHLPVFGSSEHPTLTELRRSSKWYMCEMSPNGQFLFLHAPCGLVVLLASGEGGDFARGRAYTIEVYRGSELRVDHGVAFTRCSRYCVLTGRVGHERHENALLRVDLHRMLGTHERRVPECAIKPLGPLPAPPLFIPRNLCFGEDIVFACGGHPASRGLIALTTHPSPGHGRSPCGPDGAAS